MRTSRLEAFSDGVLAIIITIMVLGLQIPESPNWSAIVSLGPSLMNYLLSFLYVGIYWTNHHHLLQVAKSVNGKTLWVNLHWLFWMSLLPLSTGWAGMHPFTKAPAVIYGVILFLCAVSYLMLQREVLSQHPNDSKVKKSFRADYKGRTSLVAYGIAAVAAYFYPVAGYALFLAVAILWIIPDMRIERAVAEDSETEIGN